jgi:uncharacterized protein (TIGR03435 family)
MAAQCTAYRLSFGMKVLLAGSRAAAITGVLVFGLVSAHQVCAQSAQTTGSPSPSFEAVSIKVDKSASGRHSLSPNLPGGRLRAINVSLAGLMTAAYQAPASRILGAPAWFDSEYFDIEATSEADNSGDENRVRLKTLLADRFKLVIHHETRQLPVYALVLSKPGKLGPQLQVSDSDCGSFKPIDLSKPNAASSSDSTPASLNCGDVHEGGDSAKIRDLGHSISMDKLVETLTGFPEDPNVDRPIVDRTGLTGMIDFTLEFARPQIGQLGTPPDESLPSFATALQEQLGLKLESQTWPVDVLIIDHVEQPSEN